jgi:hypothetical protein
MYWHVLLKRIISILLLNASTALFALNLNVQEKHLKILLTQDYGILSMDDLAVYTRDVRPAIFSGEIGKDYNYWQCFPRKNVTITLRDKGYSSEDIGNIENYGDLFINTWSHDGISNEYSMRRPWTIDEDEITFKRWQKLMKNEKYVCLAGSMGRIEKRTKNNKTHIEYSWVFEKIKTLKGCHSYFADQ